MKTPRIGRLKLVKKRRIGKLKLIRKEKKNGSTSKD